MKLHPRVIQHNTRHLVVPSLRKNIDYIRATIFNKLPILERYSNGVDIFQRKLKNYLIEKPYCSTYTEFLEQ